MLQSFPKKGRIMVKKILLGIFLLLLVAGGVIWSKFGKSSYDATKYSVTISSKPIKEGSKIDWTLPDQFDKSHSLSDDTKKLIFTFAKPTSHTVRDFLKSKDENFLERKNAFYIADIHPMPTVIRNMFAMPDLKKSSYPVILIYDKATSDKFRVDSKKDKIMVVTLDKKVVKSIDYCSDTKELEGLLE
jgi:hypothetical protein